MPTTGTTARRRPRDAGSRLDVSWMDAGACVDRGDLPWTADPEQTTPWERLVMGALCQDCPVLVDCGRFVKAADVTAGFWAGKARDPDGGCTVLAGPGWATDPLPILEHLPSRSAGRADAHGLPGLGGAA